LTKDTVWSFTTAPRPTIAIPANGPGGPILRLVPHQMHSVVIPLKYCGQRLECF
jgi:hypothetical protein